MDQKLQLVFYTENNKTHTMTIDLPILPVDSIVVNDLVNTLLTENIIETKNGALTSIKEVKLVTKTIELIPLV